jgi:hypothetical protein
MYITQRRRGSKETSAPLTLQLTTSKIDLTDLARSLSGTVKLTLGDKVASIEVVEL